MQLEGQVRSLIYHNEDNGFSIISVKEKNKKALTTVTGYCFNLFQGEKIICEGEWKTHKIHKEQFEATKIHVKEPDDLENIYLYLSSGLLKGIGSSIAKKLIKRFGVDVFEVLDKNPEEILLINGIGQNTYEKIVSSWEEKRFAPKIINELMNNGFNINLSYKIYKEFGQNSLEVLNSNPYEYYIKIPEVSFFSIDNIALKNNIDKSNPVRILTAYIHILREDQSKNGNVAYIEKDLLYSAFNLLKKEIDLEHLKLILESGINLEYFKRFIVSEDLILIQLIKNSLIEDFITESIYLISKNKGLEINGDNIKSTINYIESKSNIKLTEEQLEAVEKTLLNKISIISGGPGVGKTTVLNIIIKTLRFLKVSNIKLCAPTGRAAKKMSDSTGLPASTIHRLLEYNPQDGFLKNSNNKLDIDFLIIDESSMIDMFLFYHLLRALPKRCHILIVGDKNQLLSVDAGAVLKDLIESNTIKTVFLNKIHRQAEKSKIIRNAHLINNGKNIEYENNKEDDFFFISTSSDEKTVSLIKEMLSSRIKNAFNFDPKNETQTLTIKHDGLVGTKNLNKEIQNILNPNTGNNELQKGNNVFRINDNIMQIKNNYDKFIFNGDIGTIKSFGSNEIVSVFNEEEVVHEFKELDQLNLSYVMTTYKSQGSEYPCVIIVVPHYYSKMLDRSIFYTGITRAKKLVIVIGSKLNLERAIKNEVSRKRLTCLKEKLIRKFNN